MNVFINLYERKLLLYPFRFKKVLFDEVVIDYGLRFATKLDFEESDLVLIYAGEYYTDFGTAFIRILTRIMAKYNIQSAQFIALHGWRKVLVTKEFMADLYNGKFIEEGKGAEYSTNDDLESVFERLQSGEKIYREGELTFFMPKLTKKELQLVESKDHDHFMTYNEFYSTGSNPDVTKEEMAESESRSKFVFSQCGRVIFFLELDTLISEYITEIISRHCKSTR